jgi:hypothetical protein
MRSCRIMTTKTRSDETTQAVIVWIVLTLACRLTLDDFSSSSPWDAAGGIQRSIVTIASATVFHYCFDMTLVVYLYRTTQNPTHTHRAIERFFIFVNRFCNGNGYTTYEYTLYCTVKKYVKSQSKTSHCHCHAVTPNLREATRAARQSHRYTVKIQ